MSQLKLDHRRKPRSTGRPFHPIVSADSRPRLAVFGPRTYQSRVFDQNGDSVIDFSEIKQTMHFLGEAVTDDEVRQMIKEADLDKNGSIDFRGKLVNLIFFLSRVCFCS
ncbi:unnamed protein product [Schistosoma mattheei]|uniref:Uncharacterized protein n=1 Tax=Schistosoma mattheei TaxID=31246 RepID=A0A183NI74_9TREM|nr:unnamed protein product [Schistosoma mattheei]